MISTLLLAAILTPAPIVQAPPPPIPKNPTLIEFSCPDHDRDDQHELKILQVTGTNRVTITTILLGDPPLDTDGMVRTTINVQPIAFGQYVATVNSIAGTEKSDPSDESNQFERVPGRPSKLGIK